MHTLDADKVYHARHDDHVFSFVFTTRESPRDKLLSALGATSEPLALRQVHGRRVLPVQPALAGHEADGWIFREPSEATAAVFVADCLPVVLYSPDTGRAALVHCGHRGLSGRILEEAVQRLKAGSDPATRVQAFLGPCIGACCYQVQADVADQFAAWPSALGPHPESGWLLNLQKVAELQLAELNVKVTGVVRDCTFHMSDRYHSYRRCGAKAGRQSVVARLEGVK